MFAPIARPKRTACSTTRAFSTGSTPGSAMSTAQAWVFGAAPNAVEAPEKILLFVSRCACVSMPTTVSQVMALAAALFLHRADQLAAAAAIDEQRLAGRLRGATLL